MAAADRAVAEDGGEGRQRRGGVGLFPFPLGDIGGSVECGLAAHLTSFQYCCYTSPSSLTHHSLSFFLSFLLRVGN